MASLLNTLIGEYRVTELLGSGGMGEVYKATHTHLSRVIAIKMLSAGVSDPATVGRFYSEANIQASLRHPGVADYLGFYEYQGRPCILMEYVDGLTLNSILERRGPLPASEALKIARSISAVVAHFHEQGVLHRDIKSSNIKLSSDGRVKVLDFGIARLQKTRNLTRTGVVIGTPGTLAPEQVKGETASPATDVWQFGVLMYELLTARLPFDADNTAHLYAQILNAKFTPISTLRPSVPLAFDKIVNRCLQKDPVRRFASGGELLAALNALEAGEIAERGDAQELKPRLPSKLHFSPGRAGAVVGGAVVLVAVVAGAVYWTHATPDPPSPSLCVEPSLQAHPLGEIRNVTLSTFGVSAQVYCRGQLVGVTPYSLQARIGDNVNVLLRSEGYKPKVVNFFVTERSEYNESLDRVGDH